MYLLIKKILIYLKFLLSRILRHSGLCSLFYIKQKKFFIRFFPSSVSTTLWFDKSYSDEDYKTINKFIKRGSTFVDVGANIGHLSLYAKTCVGKEGKVIAIEGNEKIFKFLQENIRINNFEIYAYLNLIGNMEKKVSIQNRKADDMNQVVENFSEYDNIINMVTLDSICMNLETIDLLKIDVEGYEYKVLQGATKTLQKTNILMIEIINDLARDFGTSFIKTQDLIISSGFKLVNNKNGNNYIFKKT